MKPKRIEVTWEDHHERDGQGAALSMAELAPMLWKSTGYLVAENQHMIELVRDVSVNKDVSDVGASLRIMKKNIVKRSDKRDLPTRPAVPN